MPKWLPIAKIEAIGLLALIAGLGVILDYAGTFDWSKAGVWGAFGATVASFAVGYARSNSVPWLKRLADRLSAKP